MGTCRPSIEEEKKENIQSKHQGRDGRTAGRRDFILDRPSPSWVPRSGTAHQSHQMRASLTLLTYLISTYSFIRQPTTAPTHRRRPYLP